MERLILEFTIKYLYPIVFFTRRKKCIRTVKKKRKNSYTDNIYSIKNYLVFQRKLSFIYSVLFFINI